MKKNRLHIFNTAIIFLTLLVAPVLGQAPWESFPGARLLVNESRDGDSFVVEFEREGETVRHVVRLYFVDAPESAASAESDRRRVVEQMRYFGVEEPGPVMATGEEAAEFARLLMEKPFTLHTAFATAPGRSAVPRIYVMVTLADGRDLGAVLVEAGLARNRGVTRTLPDGTPGAEYAQFLGDLEAGAMLGRKGIWGVANYQRIAELRSREREEARELREIFEDAEGETTPININSATQTQLQSLNGIGRALSQRIIEHRPFQSVDDLLSIPGISMDLIDSHRNRLVVE
jgi:endonuclease YncB( thermonuclease family)